MGETLTQQRDAKQRQVESMLQRSGVPSRFKNKTFDTFDSPTEEQRTVLNWCRRYAEGFDRVFEKGVCMILTGRPGTGKTHLAVAILSAVMRKDYTGLFVSVSEMLRAIRGTYSPAAEETEQQVFNRFIGADLLVLDEVGIAIGDDQKRKALIFDVINGRYNAMRPTIIIGNLAPKDMQDYLGIRVWDRLRESEAPIISFGWESYRGKRVGADQ